MLMYLGADISFSQTFPCKFQIQRLVIFVLKCDLDHQENNVTSGSNSQEKPHPILSNIIIMEETKLT